MSWRTEEEKTLRATENKEPKGVIILKWQEVTALQGKPHKEDFRNLQMN